MMSSTELEGLMNMYSKLVKCPFNYHTALNRYCKVLEVQDRMIDTKFGKICINCFRAINAETKPDPKYDSILEVENY